MSSYTTAPSILSKNHAKKERRVDIGWWGGDSSAYTKAEFEDFYGGLDEWRQAPSYGTKKKVHFVLDTKSHDGQWPANALLDELVGGYFSGKFGSVCDFVKDLSPEQVDEITYVSSLLEDVIKRSSNQPGKQIAVLPGGGGRAFKVKWTLHGNFLTKIMNELMYYLERKVVVMGIGAAAGGADRYLARRASWRATKAARTARLQ